MTTTPLWVVNMRMKLQGAKLKSNAKIGARPYTGVLGGCAVQLMCWSNIVQSILVCRWVGLCCSTGRHRSTVVKCWGIVVVGLQSLYSVHDI